MEEYTDIVEKRWHLNLVTVTPPEWNRGQGLQILDGYMGNIRKQM